VTVFYITNRNDSQKQGTATNLKKLGFPNVNNQTLLVQTDLKEFDERAARQKVGSRFHVVLLMGDDLNDFLMCLRIVNGREPAGCRGSL